MVKKQETVYLEAMNRIRLNALIEDSDGLFKSKSHALDFVIKEGIQAVREKYGIKK